MEQEGRTEREEQQTDTSYTQIYHTHTRARISRSSCSTAGHKNLDFPTEITAVRTQLQLVKAYIYKTSLFSSVIQ